jgi:hypothetical protein
MGDVLSIIAVIVLLVLIVLSVSRQRTRAATTQAEIDTRIGLDDAQYERSTRRRAEVRAAHSDAKAKAAEPS